jgi:hypothetical protein
MLSVLEWERWLVQHEGYLPGFSATKHVIVSDNRNRLVREFLAHPAAAEWLWVLDPDIKFPPDTCSRLLGVADPVEASIVAAAYWNEYDGGERCLTWHAQTDDGLRLFRRLPDVAGAVEIGSCGMGCTLIHRTVFESLAEAHSDDPWPWFGHDIIDTSNGPDRAGEDVTFCVRAREQGFRVVGHCGVVVEHYKPTYIAHGEAK